AARFHRARRGENRVDTPPALGRDAQPPAGPFSCRGADRAHDGIELVLHPSPAGVGSRAREKRSRRRPANRERKAERSARKTAAANQQPEREVEMKPRVFGACLLLSLLAVPQAFAQGAKLQIDHLNRLADKAKAVVDVNLDRSMLQQAWAIGGKQPDAKMQAVLQGLTGVYVKSFEFDAQGAYTAAD